MQALIATHILNNKKKRKFPHSPPLFPIRLSIPLQSKNADALHYRVGDDAKPGMQRTILEETSSWTFPPKKCENQLLVVIFLSPLIVYSCLP